MAHVIPGTAFGVLLLCEALEAQMPDSDQHAAFEAADRMGALEVLGTQINVAVSMLRVLYTTHPEPAKVRYTFDRLIGQLLSSPDIWHDPDREVILRDMAATLFRPLTEVDPA